MRLIRTLISIIGIIGIMVIIALVIGYYLFSLTPPIKARILPVAVSAEAAQNLDQKLETVDEEIEAAVAANEEKEVRLIITEQEINNKMLDALAEGESSLKKIAINFDNKGRILVYAELETPGVDVKTGAIGQIQVMDGKPTIVIEDFDLGKLPLPQAANSGVEKLLNIMLELKLTDIPVELTAVEITDTQLTATGLTKTTD